jgi:NitT/TauT family transport system permease protein
LFKLRVPHAVPYIFTALKISATASVVGAIIGELPSGIQDGLGGKIINFAQYYAQGPARLWSTNLVAALCGIAAFIAVSAAERLIVRWSPSGRKS